MFPTNFHEAVNSGFAMYLFESAGRDDLVSTRVAKINSSIKDFKYLVKQGKNPNDYISIVLAKHSLKEDELTLNEIRKIERAINGN